MSSPDGPDQNANNDAERLEQLLDQWEELRETGRKPDLAVLCRDCPHLLTVLEDRVVRLARLDQMLISTHTFSESDTRQPEESLSFDRLELRTHLRNFHFLARGGLGRVYQARDATLRRDTAVKLLNRQHCNSPLHIERFRIEAEITSRLDHPGIVPIYGYGLTEHGQPYYAMRLLHGETLQQKIGELFDGDASAGRPADAASGGLSLPESQRRSTLFSLLSALITVARTVHYAHTRGIVHRDLKPANIMIGRYGEVVVVDWGMATTITHTHVHLDTDEDPLLVSQLEKVEPSSGGTPVYMSPEQYAAPGEAHASSDVYSLGATLFHVLTGKPPFDPTQTLSAIRMAVIRGRFEFVGKAARETDSALKAICQKAMRVEPDERYRTAEELAEDLQRYLADEPVSAHQESAWRQGRRWLLRHSTTAAALSFLVILTMSLLSVHSIYSARTAQAERTARVQAVSAKAKAESALQAAVLARNESLQSASAFAASVVSSRLSDRLRILETHAASSVLTTALQYLPPAASQTAERLQAVGRLQQLMTSFRDRSDLEAERPESWFLCDRHGWQLARIPAGDSIGQNFAHRDYFHGNGSDLPPGTPGNPSHISGPTVSAAFQSMADGQFKIALTVPVWSPEVTAGSRQFLGVLGMSVSLGEFAELQQDLNPRQVAMVVDLGVSVLENRTYTGLVLHHPHFLSAGVRTLRTPMALSPAMLQQIQSSVRLAAGPSDSRPGRPGNRRALLIESFADPLAASSAPAGVGAVCVVGIPGRTPEQGRPGWVVIVAETPD